MLQDSGYLINRHRRSVRCPGFLGARLRPGSTGSLHAAGVGDGILIHPDKAFFAVGDGSDRNPRAVRQAMECFVTLLEGFPGLKAERMYRDEEAAELRDSVLLAAAGLIRDLYPSDGCTFTGILLFRTAGGFRGLLFHAGDSLLYRIDRESGETQRLTENNFWFVGRTSRFSQAEEITLQPSSLLLLATDGFAALLPSGEVNGTTLGEMCRRHPVEELPDLLFDRYDRPGEVLDDAAVLCLVPAGQTGGSFQPIILGATSADEEIQRTRDIREHPPGDCYQNGTQDTAAGSGCGAIL